MSYYTKITKAGLAAITAAMNNNSKVPITYMAFGDGNGYIPEPDENATSLVNEVYRVGVNKVEVHSKNPNWLVCEAIIPSAVGGFNIREVALYDSTGNTMLAIANYPPTYKPTVEEGAAKIQTIRIVIQVDNSGNFELIVDPDVVLATIQYVQDMYAEQDKVNDRVGNLWREKLSGYSINDRVMLENGKTAISLVDHNIEDPNQSMQNWKIVESSSFTIFEYNKLFRSIKTVDEKFLDIRSVKDFGAIGDNTYHPLSERFSSISMAQVAYPHATSLEDSIDWCAIQACLLTPGSTFIPDGKYVINRPLEFVKETRPQLFGFFGKRPSAMILTTEDYSHRSLVRCWSESHYNQEEQDRSVPPVSMPAGSHSKYVNISNIWFNVRGSVNGKVTVLDLLGQQESSHIDGIIITGDNNVDYTIKIRNTSTHENSCNGFSIKNVVTYARGMVGELYVSTAGGDIDIDNWVTTQFECSDIPFYISTGFGDVTIRNLHCEAYAVGKPIIQCQNWSLSIVQSMFMIHNLISDILYCPTGTGGGKTGITASNLQLYPKGGQSSAITNASTINVINNMGETIKLKPKNYGFLFFIENYSAGVFRASDENANRMSCAKENAILKLASSSWSSTAPVVIPYHFRNEFAQVNILLFGRNSTGQPFSVEVKVIRVHDYSGGSLSNIEVTRSVNAGVVTANIVNGYLNISTNENGFTDLRGTLTGNMNLSSLYV